MSAVACGGGTRGLLIKRCPVEQPQQTQEDASEQKIKEYQ